MRELLTDPGVLGASALLAVGVLLAGLADRLRLPALLLFLGLGMLVGDDGLNLISFSDAALTQTLGTVALIVILYTGGLGTRPSDVRRAALPGALLATVGVAVTAGTVAIGAYLLLDTSPMTALLVGSVVASTDAAAVFAALRSSPLPRRLTSLLELESGGNDPVAILLTIGLLTAVSQPVNAEDWVLFGLLQLGGGLLAGLVLGRLGAALLTRLRLVTTGLYPALALGVAGITYGIATALGASGFLAVYVAGIVVGARVARHRRAILTFHDAAANLAEIALFLVLGLLVFPSQLPGVALSALGVTAVLILVARPLAVALCLTPLRYGWREQLLVGWAGLRGAVPIVLATFALTAGHPDGMLIFNVTFFVVLVSTALQGVTLGPLATRLGLHDPTASWRPIASAMPLEQGAADLVELEVIPGLAIVGRTLEELPPPDGILPVAVLRGTDSLRPESAMHLQPGDRLLLTVPGRPGSTRRVVAWARGEPPPPREPGSS